MKEKILSKIVIKDYNNNLEEVLSKKDFSEEVKNTLLSMLYKIENGYSDYKTIKQNTFQKNEYIEKLTNIIDKDCEQIEFISPKEKKEEFVSNKEKKILCLPMEHRILYSIAKIQKKPVVVKYMDKNIGEALTFLLNTGNNINIVEPLRDFNGFSWDITIKEIESLNCNLVYQNIIYLVGNKFVDNWVNNYEPIVDYFDLLKTKIEEKYGKKLKDRIIDKIIKIAIKIKADYDDKFAKNVASKLEDIKDEISLRENIVEYITEISKQKNKIEKQIGKIDKTLANSELLIEELKKRNKKLPENKQLFTINALKEELTKTRKKLLEEIKECNEQILPEKFLEKKEELEKELYYFDIFDDFNINKNIIRLQKDIIKCMRIDLRKATTKKQLINALYNYRYYNFLPIDKKRFICNVKSLEKSMNLLTTELINKAVELKVINKISDDEFINVRITEQLLLSKVIAFEDIFIELTKYNNELYLTVFDEETKEIKIKLNDIKREDIVLKLNKKIKFLM